MSKTRIRQLFWEASELPQEERAGFLRGACGGDDVLFEEVASLLSAGEDTENFLVGAASDEHSDLLESARASSGVVSSSGVEDVASDSKEPVEHPESIGPYRVIRLLGSGGMGDVYLAEQEEPVRRRVALKVIKLGMDTREIVRRFELERQTLARMNHSCIAKIYDSGTSEDGRPYFAMEHVPGTPINDYCDAERLDVRERLAIFLDVCDGVLHAHQKGIIHRDLKPNNLLVDAQGGRVVPKVIDFGIAKATDGEGDTESLLTREGRVIGTPEYMSPEQVAWPAREDIDSRSDIYSLGVVLYELLAGVLPIDRKKLSSSDPYDFVRAIRDLDPPRLSTRIRTLPEKDLVRVALARSTGAISLARQVREDLDWIVGQALEKDRARRYASVSDLAADVRRFLGGEPVLARPATMIYRAGKLLQRHRSTVFAGVGVLLALVVGFAVSVQQYYVAVEARAEVGRRLEDTRGALAAKRDALTRSDALRLASTSEGLMEEDPELALVLAVEAARHHRSGATDEVLARAVDAYVPSREVQAHDGRSVHLALSSDGEYFATTGEDRKLLLWSVGTLKRRHTLTHKRGYFSAAAFSPDSRRLTGAVKFGAVEWDVKSGERLAIYGGHRGSTMGVAYSPSGDRVVTVGRDKTGRIFDSASHELIGELIGHEGTVYSPSFSPDGRRILTSSSDKSARVWDAATGEELLKLQERGLVNPAVFSPDGRWIGTASRSGFARVWNAETGETVFTLQMKGGVLAVVFSLSSSHLIAGDQVGLVAIAEHATGRIRYWSESHGAMVLATRLGSRGRYVLSSSADKTIRVIDGATFREIAVLRGHKGRVNDAQLDASAQRVLSVGFDGFVRSWDVSRGFHALTLEQHETRVYSALFTPDGRIIATSGAAPDPVVRLWDAENRSLVGELRGHTESTVCVRFSEDGRRFLTLSGDLTARVWDIESRRTISVLAGHPSRVRSADLTPDGRVVITSSATVGPNGEMLPLRPSLWDAETGKLVHTIAADGRIDAAVFSPDGERFAIGDPLQQFVWIGRTSDGELLHRMYLDDSRREVMKILWFPDSERILVGHLKTSVWNASTGELQCYAQIDRWADDIAISPDGRRFLVGLRDETARVCDSFTGEQIFLLPGHLISARVVRFSPDGRYLFTAGDSPSSVFLWDGETGNRIRTLTGHLGRVYSASFSRDGAWIAAAANDTLVRLHPINPLPVAESVVPRGPTAEEIEQFGLMRGQ